MAKAKKSAKKVPGAKSTSKTAPKQPKKSAASQKPAKQKFPEGPLLKSVSDNPAVSANAKLPKEPAPEKLIDAENTVVETPAPSEQPAAIESPEVAAQQSLAESRATSPEPPQEPEIIEAEPLKPLTIDEELAQASSIELPPSVKKIRNRQRIRRILLSLTALVLLAGAGYWYFVVREVDVTQQNQSLIDEVGRLAVVPKGEEPAVTTVVDESQVNQEFLRNARKGDKVLLFFQAGRAIVYRPSSHQIVNMGPLETPKPRVFIRSGTSDNKTAAIAQKLGGITDFILASQDESPKKDYQKTVVVDVTGTRPDVAQRLAKFLNASVVTMPDGESKPDADMLVIVGSDFKP